MFSWKNSLFFRLKSKPNRASHHDRLAPKLRPNASKLDGHLGKRTTLWATLPLGFGAVPEAWLGRRLMSGVGGGEAGIRTLGTLAGTAHFECGAFDHSATSPLIVTGVNSPGSFTNAGA